MPEIVVKGKDQNELWDTLINIGVAMMSARQQAMLAQQQQQQAQQEAVDEADNSGE